MNKNHVVLTDELLVRAGSIMFSAYFMSCMPLIYDHAGKLFGARILQSSNDFDMAFGGLVETRADHPEAPVYQVRWPMNDTAIRAEFGLGTDTVVGIGQFLQAIAWLDSPLCGLIPKERNVRLLAYMQDKGGIVRVAEATRLQDGFELQRYSLDELFEATAEKGWLEHTYVLALERTRLYR